MDKAEKTFEKLGVSKGKKFLGAVGAGALISLLSRHMMKKQGIEPPSFWERLTNNIEEKSEKEKQEAVRQARQVARRMGLDPEKDIDIKPAKHEALGRFDPKKGEKGGGTIFAPNDKDLVAHEVGHALDYSRYGKKIPGGKYLFNAPHVLGKVGPGLAGDGATAFGLTLPMLGLEASASAKAIKDRYRQAEKGKEKEEVKKSLKKLLPAFGTYTGSAVANAGSASFDPETLNELVSYLP